ncbi:MAG: RNA polymerase factor sigma-54 [Burkholderiaceae bacterium]|nr:RNA polymerase factor sigma-54 [Burkholderiaceae bacterium]
MKPSLQLKLTQHLALTPQLQQSIRLLQLSTLELNQELEQILSDNPLLERLDDPLDECLRISASGTIEPAGGARDLSGPEAGDDGAGGDGDVDAQGPDRFEPGERAGDDGETAEYGGPGDWNADPAGRTGDADDDQAMPQLAANGRTLRDHLLAQLAATQATAQDCALVALLIDNLNDDGYLDADLESLFAMLPEEAGIEAESLRTALSLLQSFDPPGVGGRDLREGLLLQLDAMPDARRERSAPETFALARSIVDESLALLGAHDFARLRRTHHCDDEALRDAQELIRSLNPRPGAAFSIDEPTYVVPDVFVRRGRNGWEAVLNPDVLPRLRINDVYARILRHNKSGAGELAGQLQEARWLIKNVQQRYDTILRVSQAIVERQKSYFSHGAVAMRPLVLREIAEVLEMHESTISRVTTQKFMLTPFGTVELKYFFSSHVATEAGGAASSTAIREVMRQIVDAEDARKPLSDGRIAEILGDQGIVVARRTVAKYRESLLIPPVSQRKVL